MKKILFLFIAVLSIHPARSSAEETYKGPGDEVAITHSWPANQAYEKGFVRRVMRQGESGVGLWNRRLIESDAPGAGSSNKGVFFEPVYGEIQIKKIIPIDDPRCLSAAVVLFSNNRSKALLKVVVNGHATKTHMGYNNSEVYVPIETSWLRKGDNEIILSCPEAREHAEGWNILISNVEEYFEGRWDVEKGKLSYEPVPHPGLVAMIGAKSYSTYAKNIGDYSYISKNNGKKWSRHGKGQHPAALNSNWNRSAPDQGELVGEYGVRLNLERYSPEGLLVSPVIDLWKDPADVGILVPFTKVWKITMRGEGETPEGTDIEWQYRTGVTFDPLNAEDWSDWITVGSGKRVEEALNRRIDLQPTQWDPARTVTTPHIRYIQWRAMLRTRDPHVSPTIREVSFECEMRRRMDLPRNIIVREFYHPDIRYSSIGFDYQSAEEPNNQVVIQNDDIDVLLEGAASEFDAMVRLLDYASRRWVYDGPIPEYPKWNTVDIQERIETVGDGGMCIQYSAYLNHLLTAVGFHARHVNIQYHEVTEVWSNDFEKWIYLDPTQGVDLFKYDKETGIPLSLYDIHRVYYTYWGITEPIDWMKNPVTKDSLRVPRDELPVDFSTTDPRVALGHIDWEGYFHLLKFLRMMPRNDFSTRSIPEPLQQGGPACYTWDGYVNWYDEYAPPQLQNSFHTDRVADFWPTLNQVCFEAIPNINGDMIFIRMITFTPSFASFQVRVNQGEWQDSDERFVWHMRSGINRLEMRARSKFGVSGHPSHIELNYMPRIIPKPVGTANMK